VNLIRLYIQDYRNIRQSQIEFADKINCFVGQNGMGKTNVLDSIYYLSFCRSALTSTDQQVIRHDTECMMLKGTYKLQNDEETDISCIARTAGRKQFRCGSKEYRKFSDHIGLIPLVMVSPSDMNLISGTSEERRRFMDMVISQYDKDYLVQLIEYNKALQQRNALLRQETVPDNELLSVLEHIMERTGIIIFNRRHEFIEQLVPLFEHYYSEIGSSSEHAGLTYRSHLQESSLTERLEKGRPKEFMAGYTLYGIHRDELEMTLDGYPIRREGSQGQNKSYLVALKLSQYLFLSEACGKRKPLLLLDDLFDKLDALRVTNILNIVSGPEFGQIFITDTDTAHIDSCLKDLGQPYRIFTVNNGEIV